MCLLLVGVDLLNPRGLCLWMMVLLLDVLLVLALRMAVMVDDVVPRGFGAVDYWVIMSSTVTFSFTRFFL